MRGSREGFTESEKLNVALIRKRLRDPRMKVEEQEIGTRSHTMTALVYMEDLVYPDLLHTIRERMDAYEIDGILDSGMLEQLTEKHWLSPFPQFQATERPDRAASAVLEGRVVLVTDHSPTVLVFPSDYNSFFQTSDAGTTGLRLPPSPAFCAFCGDPGHELSGDLCGGNHLAYKPPAHQSDPVHGGSQEGSPFPSLGEVLLMEISFELIREAGIRLPGPIGNTIGIVGGLIIGQSAVAANVVSPIVVIVVAFTALCSLPFQ